MEKSDFIKLVNTLIDDKLREILPGMIKTALNESIKSVKKSNIENSNVKKLVPKNNNTIAESNKKYSSNPIINKILNDMAKSPIMSSDGSAISSYKSMLQEQYSDTSDELIFNTGNMKSITQNKTKPSIDVIKSQILNTAPDVNPNVVNNMVKDYRGVLKAMDKKAKESRNLPAKHINLEE